MLHGALNKKNDLLSTFMIMPGLADYIFTQDPKKLWFLLFLITTKF